MFGPVDYTLKSPSPMDRLLGGLDQGQAARLNDQQMQLAQAQDGRAQQELAMRQQAFQQQQAAAQAQQEQARAMQSALGGLGEKVRDGTATHQDFMQVGTMFPELAGQMKTIWDGQSEEKRKADLQFGAQAAMAIKSGNPEIAIKMFEDRATAADNSGDKMEADMSRAMAGMTRADPNAALANFGLILSQNSEDLLKAIFGDAPDPSDATKGAPAGTMWVNPNRPEDGVKPIPGAPASTDQFKNSSDLRSDWTGLQPIKDFQKQVDAYGKIRAASKAGTGGSDVALVYAYIKMLDPSSVVREGEFATAENTSGVPDRISQLYNKLLNGSRLTPEIRADFVARSDEIYTAAEGQYDQLRSQYVDIAKRNGLSVEDAVPDFRIKAADLSPADQQAEWRKKYGVNEP